MNDLIPAEAHLFFPKPHSTKYNDPHQRVAFDGNTQFNDDENQQIVKFKEHCSKQNFALKSNWTDNMILRFLYANNFKMGKTLSSLKDHMVWRETTLPIQIDDSIKKLLNSGIIYFHGRDNQFRPIVILNLHMIDLKKMDVDVIIRLMILWMEYVIQECMLPGQIETWVFVADMKGMGAATLALSNMRKIFSLLQENYKCRLRTLYILNVTAAMYIPYQVVKKFLDEVTVQKIQFYKTQVPTTLFETTNAEQIEQKYGGKAPDATHFWPPRPISNNYFVSPDDSKVLTTKEQYSALYKNGTLKNMRVRHSFIMEDTESTSIIPERTHKPAMSAKIDIGNGLLSPELARSIASSPNPSSDQILLNTHHIGGLHMRAKSENIESYYGDGTDYIDYMDENFDPMQKIKQVSRDFKASFITSLRLPCVCDFVWRVV